MTVSDQLRHCFSCHTPLRILWPRRTTADHVLTIIRIKQWQQDRAALATSRTTDYTRTGWKRNQRTADARIVRVLIFEQAFSRLSQDEQAILATRPR
jgi:hypothetical protein